MRGILEDLELKDKWLEEKVGRVLLMGDEEISWDRFLFSCLEQENVFVSGSIASEKQVSWPPMDEMPFGEKPQEEFLDLAKQMMAWYCETFEALRSPDPLNFEKLNKLIKPLVCLRSDFLSLIKRTKTAIPAFEESGPKGIWLPLKEIVEEVFLSNSPTVLRYFQWCFAPDKIEFFEPSSSLDSGRRNFSRGRPASRGGRGKDREFRGGGRSSGNRASNGRPGQRFGGGRGKPRFNNDRGGSNNRNRELEGEVAATVSAAIDKIKADDSLNEIVLEPRNSFYRRIQHKLISEAGFESESVGEGNDRSVKVIRKG